MGIAQGILSVQILSPVTWRADWEWGLPLIVMTVVVHVLGLERSGFRTPESVHQAMKSSSKEITVAAAVAACTAMGANY